jgi:hypothetical protein
MTAIEDTIVDRSLELLRSSWSTGLAVRPRLRSRVWAQLGPKCLPFAVGATLVLSSFTAGWMVSQPIPSPQAAAALPMTPGSAALSQHDGSRRRLSSTRAEPLCREQLPPLVSIADLPVEEPESLAAQARCPEATRRRTEARSRPGERAAM